jgi:hypothetical protein
MNWIDWEDTLLFLDELIKIKDNKGEVFTSKKILGIRKRLREYMKENKLGISEE